jgi:hypothetical protein
MKERWLDPFAVRCNDLFRAVEDKRQVIEIEKFARRNTIEEETMEEVLRRHERRREGSWRS